MAKVTVITATVGNPLLENCLSSVRNQTHSDVQHLVFVDGDRPQAKEVLSRHSHVNVIQLPYSVGKDRWNGHRMYAAGPFLAEGEYVIWLDDDNSLEPTHIEDCLKVVQSGNDWAFSFRNIVDKDGNILCQDDCESLGKWASILDPQDFFIDVNCYFVPTKLAIHLGPAWYRKFREPNQPEVDRVLSAVLRGNNLKYDTTYKYTVNYTVGNTQNSVQSGFFLHGNIEMLKRYGGKLPWKE